MPVIQEMLYNLRPIFTPEIKFLKEMLDIDIPENVCWFNKMNIYGFQKSDNKRIQLFRVKVRDLKLTLVKSNPYNLSDLKTYEDFIEELWPQVEKLEQEALEVTKEFIEKYPTHKPLIFTSTGKDSMVLQHIVRLVNPNIPAKFNNTSLDTSYTYKIAKQLENTEILNPKEGFYQWRARNNFVPSQLGRACCNLFKEGETQNHIASDEPHLFFYGMRNAESTTRQNYGYEWHNNNWKANKWIGCLPIRRWTDLDIWLYIMKNNLIINDTYTFGYNRVGCSVPCPFRTDYENLLDKYFFNNQFNRWQKILKEDFISNRKWTLLNCTIQEYLNGAWKHGVHRSEPTDEVEDEFMEYTGLDYDIAIKYFNNICGCGKKVKKDEVALTMKLYGRQVSVSLCYDCLAKAFEVTKKDLKQMVKDFKIQGCNLF